MFAQAKRQLSRRQAGAGQARPSAKPPTVSKRVTPPKNRPTSSKSTCQAGLDRQVGAAQQRSSQEEVRTTMEWVEFTARTLEEAKDLALDRLGVAADDAEFEVLAEPKPGLVRSSPRRGPGSRPGPPGAGSPEGGSPRSAPAQERRWRRCAEDRQAQAAAVARSRTEAGCQAGAKPAAPATKADRRGPRPDARQRRSNHAADRRSNKT